MIGNSMHLSLPTEFCINKLRTQSLRLQDSPNAHPCLPHFSLTGSLSPLWDLAITRAGPQQVSRCQRFASGRRINSSAAWVEYNSPSSLENGWPFKMHFKDLGLQRGTVAMCDSSGIPSET